MSQMKVLTERKILLKLVNVPFNAVTHDMLYKLSQIAPNLRLEAVEVHSQKPVQVRLCTIDWDWQITNRLNLPDS